MIYYGKTLSSSGPKLTAVQSGGFVFESIVVKVLQ
jgi:hypothetical protein